MPNSYVDYTVTGNQTAFSSVSLSYLLTSHLGVSITSTSGTVYTVDAADITISETPNLTVTIDAAKYGSSGSVYVIANGDVVRIARTTPIDDLTRTFNDGSVLKASDLNSQSSQLLFSLQEQEDKGVGSLPVDTDNRYDAGNRIIKNIATPISGNHAATMQFVADAIEAGGVQSLSSPESFSLTGNDFTDTGADAVYDFPVAPASLEANTYIVEVSGVIQHPGDDYTITQNANDSVRITLLDQDNIVGTSEKVQIRNFGVSRGQALQPFISSSTAPAMKVQQGDSVTGQNTMEFKNSGGTNQAAFTSDGKFRVGTGVGTAATQVEIRSSSTENAIEVGDYSTGNTAGVELRHDVNSGTNDDFGQILVSGQTSISSSTKAVDVERNGSSLFYVDYGGNVVNTGNITNAGTLTNTGLISTPAGLSVTAGSLTMSGGTVLDVNGTTEISGGVTVTNSADITLGNNCDISLSTGNITLANGNIETTTGYVKQPGGLVQKVFFQEDRPYRLSDCPMDTVCRLYLVSNGTTESEVAAGVATDYVKVTATDRESLFGDASASGSDFQRVFFEVSIAPKLAGNKIELRFESHIISEAPYGHVLFGKTKSDAPLTDSQFSGSDLSNATVLRARGAGENGTPDYNASNAHGIYTPVGSTALTEDGSDGGQDQHGSEASQNASYLYTVESGDVGSTLTFHVFFANNNHDDVDIGIHSDFNQGTPDGFHRRGMSLLSATEYWA